MAALVVVVSVLLVLAVLAVFSIFKGAVWACAELWAHVGAIGWLPVAVLIGWCVLELRKRAGSGGSVDEGKTKRGNRRRIVAGAATAMVIAANLSLGIAATRIDRFWQDRKPQTTDLYTNHDLAKLSGACVRLAMLRHAERIQDRDEARALGRLADLVPRRWEAMAEANDPRAVALGDANLTGFIIEPRARALHAAEWDGLLRSWREAGGGSSPSDATISGAARTIAADFGITLREALKADFVNGGEAWAAMQLDLAQRMLNRTPVSAAAGSEPIQRAMADVHAMLADDAAGLPALHRAVLDTRQAQDEHSAAVAAAFDKTVGLLEQIARGVRTGLTNEAIKVQIDMIEFDQTLTDEEKRRRIDPLLQQRMTLMKPYLPAERFPIETQDFVKRIYAGASPIVRFAALARVGLDEEADALAAEIERTTEGLSDEQRYEYFVARGDRYWWSKDFWRASTWYAQAMRIDMSDPDVVYRAAESTLLGPSGSQHLVDVQRARSWVEVCLGRQRAEGGTRLHIARLRASLASLLARLGEADEALVPADAAWRSLEESGWQGNEVSIDLLGDLAGVYLLAGRLEQASVVLGLAVEIAGLSRGNVSGTGAFVLATRAGNRQARGDLAGAEADIERSIEWGEAQEPRNERSLAIRYASRADIRQLRGDIAGAEADIARSIEWGEAQKPRDERGLAIWYASRAGIRQERGDLAGAEADIARSIDWFEAQEPRDERSLAIRYASRAGIRQGRGDLAGAEADIARSIEWFEAQEPRDERSLAIDYASRARIRRLRGDLAGAEADIARSIEWFEAQEPRDERSLAIRYASRAGIRQGRGDLAGAEADIARSIDWGEAQEPRDERNLAIDYASRASIRRLRGDLAGAEADIARSIDWFEAQEPRDERSLAIWYASRAGIRQHRGDLAGAEADIARSIDWGEAQEPRDERSLAIWYASRASIRKDRGDLAGAEADIARSIDWGEAQEPRDERSLAIDYASRASIRRLRGDLARAEADIARSIEWFEAQEPRDERSLAIDYASRASIRRLRGDLAGAEADIARSIEWFEAQEPRDEWSLAIWYATRARIRRDRGALSGAGVDIARSIEWFEAQDPRDERSLAILYSIRESIR